MSTENLAAALALAQGEYQEIPKDKINPHYKNKYASLDSIFKTVRPVNAKHGLAVAQLLDEDEQGHPIVRTVLLHSSGERLEAKTRLIVDRNNMQGMGSAMTYARRYGLAGILGVCPDEDDDGEAAAKAPPKAQKPKPKPSAPKKTTVETTLAECSTPAAVKTQLEKWLEKKPINSETAQSWYETLCKAEDRCEEWGEDNDAVLTMTTMLKTCQTYLEAEQVL